MKLRNMMSIEGLKKLVFDKKGNALEVETETGDEVRFTLDLLEEAKIKAEESDSEFVKVEVDE